MTTPKPVPAPERTAKPCPIRSPQGYACAGVEGHGKPYMPVHYTLSSDTWIGGDVQATTPAPEPQGKEEYPTIQSAVDEWVEYWKRSEDQPQDIERMCPWGSVARAYLAIRAELAQAREERDCILVECSEQWESGGEIPRWMVNEGLLIRARKELSNNEKD